MHRMRWILRIAIVDCTEAPVDLRQKRVALAVECWGNERIYLEDEYYLNNENFEFGTFDGWSLDGSGYKYYSPHVYSIFGNYFKFGLYRDSRSREVNVV